MKPAAFKMMNDAFFLFFYFYNQSITNLKIINYYPTKQEL